MGGPDSEMEAQLAEERFFDQYFPYGAGVQQLDDRATKAAKTDKDGQKGEGRRGSGKGRDGGRDPKRKPGDWSERRTGQPWRRQDEGSEISELRANVAQLQRLALRHEDTLSLITSELSYVMFFRLNIPALLVCCAKSMERPQSTESGSAHQTYALCALGMPDQGVDQPRQGHRWRHSVQEAAPGHGLAQREWVALPSMEPGEQEARSEDGHQRRVAGGCNSTS